MRGTLVGHSGWVTSLATSLEKYTLHSNGTTSHMPEKLMML